MVGYAQDAFDMDVIAKEFDKRYASTPDDKDEEPAKKKAKTTELVAEGVDDDESKIPLGKHYMVFAFRTWTSKSKPINFVVARYALATLTGRWIRFNKRQITSTLAFFNFYVNANSFDGATENRSALKQELTLTLKNLLPDLFDSSEELNDEDLSPTERYTLWLRNIKKNPDIDRAITMVSKSKKSSTTASTAASGTTSNIQEPVSKSSSKTVATSRKNTKKRSYVDLLDDEESDDEDDVDLPVLENIVDTTGDELMNWFDNHDRHPDSINPPRKKYRKDDLPWDMRVAYPHPTVNGLIIVAAADMPHAVKKQVNAIEFSGKPKHKRDIHLNGLPIQLRMGHDIWQQTPDYTHPGSIRLFRKLSSDVFNKTSKSRMRAGFAFNAVGGSLKRCMEIYKGKIPITIRDNAPFLQASAGTFDSYIELCSQTDRFVDVVNGNFSKGCSNINSPNHEHVYDLLDYVKFLTHWKAQADMHNNPNLYFPRTTHEDTVWTALSFVIIARTQLPKDFDLVQRRGGTDFLEKTFCQSRGKNSGANAQGTNGQIAGISSNALLSMSGSAKGNCGKSGNDTLYFTNELDATKVPKRKIM